MNNFDYRQYSLSNLEKWIEDAINSSEASPQEIYDVIKNVVADNYYCYKNHTERCYELLALLNGNGGFKLSEVLKEREYYEGCNTSGESKLTCDKNDKSPECQKAWNDFWGDVDEREYNIREAEYYNKRAELDAKPNKWILPVELDGLTGDCYIQLPDDLLEVANLKEGDQVEWIPQGNGSYVMKKVDVHT